MESDVADSPDFVSCRYQLLPSRPSFACVKEYSGLFGFAEVFVTTATPSFPAMSFLKTSLAPRGGMSSRENSAKDMLFPTPPPSSPPSYPAFRNEGTAASEFIDHPRVIRNTVSGASNKRHFAGCDVYHERGLPGLGSLNVCFYSFQCHGLDELE